MPLNSLATPSETTDHDRYRTLFDLAPVAVYSCDAAGVIRDYNSRAGAGNFVRIRSN